MNLAAEMGILVKTQVARTTSAETDKAKAPGIAIVRIKLEGNAQYGIAQASVHK
ncbi:MAG: hypothetical protein Fur0036_06280 [Fimbriimonadaceae bacterium]